MTIPRWTTARAVSGCADLRLMVVSPTFSPSNERMGRVASSERVTETRVKGFGGGGLVKREVEGVWVVDRKEIEDGRRNGVINAIVVFVFAFVFLKKQWI